MLFREANSRDITQMQEVRNSVTENVLSDPSRITEADYQDYLFRRGKGWVCEDGETIIGFAVADLKGKNIWALFLRPGYERKGIGKKLHDLMLNWYFSQTSETVWLSTAPNTRAENFYRKLGWKKTGLHGKAELRFEMTHPDWKTKRANLH